MPLWQDSTFPFLLIRSIVGDIGGRPFPPGQPFWESPDILIMDNVPGPFDRKHVTYNPVPGSTYRVFVHCWNLGRSPVFGARAAAYWVDSGFFDPQTPSQYTPTYIGGARVDLDERSKPGSHQLVELDELWQPSRYYESLFAVLESPLDTARSPVDPSADRHVAVHNIFLFLHDQPVAPIIAAIAARWEPGPGRSLYVVNATTGIEPLAVVATSGPGPRTVDVPEHIRAFAPIHPALLRLATGTGVDGDRHDATPGPPNRAGNGVAFTPPRPVPRLGVTDLPTQLADVFGIADLTAGAFRQAVAGGSPGAQLIRFISAANQRTVYGYSLILAD
jgi:hypothetical protein